MYKHGLAFEDVEVRPEKVRRDKGFISTVRSQIYTEWHSFREFKWAAGLRARRQTDGATTLCPLTPNGVENWCLGWNSRPLIKFDSKLRNESLGKTEIVEIHGG